MRVGVRQWIPHLGKWLSPSGTGEYCDSLEVWIVGKEDLVSSRRWLMFGRT